MSDCMSQENAINMDSAQAVQILEPMMRMMLDQNGCPISSAYFALGKAIEALQAEPEKGKWILKPDEKFHCDKCDGIAPKGFRWDFCPHCGTDMRGES